MRDELQIAPRQTVTYNSAAFALLLIAILAPSSLSMHVFSFSKLEFVPFTPRYTDLKRKVPRSDRDVIREELRGGFNTTLGEYLARCPARRH